MYRASTALATTMKAAQMWNQTEGITRSESDGNQEDSEDNHDDRLQEDSEDDYDDGLQEDREDDYDGLQEDSMLDCITVRR